VKLALHVQVTASDPDQGSKVVRNSASMTETFSLGPNLDPKRVIDTQKKNSIVHLVALNSRFLLTPCFLGVFFPPTFFFEDADLGGDDFFKSLFHHTGRILVGLLRENVYKPVLC
jgi:hypothetical protein